MTFAGRPAIIQTDVSANFVLTNTSAVVTKETMTMRLIDADELKKCAIPCEIHNGALTELCVPLYQIDNAPTVEYPFYQEAYQTGYDEGKNERPQGEWVGVINYIKHLKETTGETYLVNSTYYDYEVYCNKCWVMSTRKTKFCSNCGADMRGKEE